MKLNLIATALVVSTSLLAQAQEPSPAASKPVSRADVKAEARAANKAGQIARGDCEVSTGPQSKSTKSRADVSAEAKSAVKTGAIARGDCEAPPLVADTKSTKSRAEVKVEAQAANKAGAIKKGDAP